MFMLDVDLCIHALAIIKHRNKPLWQNLHADNHCAAAAYPRLESIYANRCATPVGVSAAEHATAPAAKRKRTVTAVRAPSLAEHPNYSYLEPALDYVDRCGVYDVLGEEAVGGLRTVSAGVGSQRVMAWVLSSYRRARWLWLLPDLGADTKRMARGLQTFIVSHYAFHAGAEAMVKYVTHTLYYKFMLELWDTSHEQLQSGKYYGHEFSRYGPEALNRSALCKEQRRMALVILKIRSQRNRGKGPAVRCVMFMLQILESLARSYVKLSRRKAPHAGMETVGLQKAYLQIYERRTKTFNDKYMVEICNILRRHENSVKALELMIKETLKFLQSLDWKSLHLNQKDCDELASYRKFIQCSLLLTDNTSLIAGCRLVISKWPTKP